MTFGGYRVLHQIGSGVQGPVFRTSDPRRDRLVAVKAFQLDLLPEDAARLAQALGRLVESGFSHPSAVGRVEAGLEAGLPFLAMEYDTGETLDVALRRLAPAAPSVALPLIRQLAEVLDAAAAAGLGHGALHPRDVFLSSDDRRVRITGIGVARALEEAGRRAAVRRPYAAPERIAGAKWDVRADVYSLAVLAHELLTGQRALTAASRPAPAGADRAVLSPAERRALSIALSELPDRRFASADAFVSALEAARDEPVPLLVAAEQEPQVPVPDAPPSLDPPAAPGDLPDHEALASPAMALPVRGADGSTASAPPHRRAPAPSIDPPLVAVPVSSLPPSAPGVAGTSYPWIAIAAMALAGVMLGVVGYRLGLLRSPDPARSRTAGPAAAPAASPDLTEVPVLPPPSAVAPEAPVRERAERRPDRPAPVSAPAGRLVVRSSPAGALVTVDGRLYGETPVTIPDLPLGAHLVQVARPGHVPGSQRVMLTPADPSRAVTVNLVPGVDGASVVASGALTVESRPRGAMVSVDGRRVGTTPLRLGDLRPGQHAVRLDLAGYRALTTQVTVAAGPAGRLAVTLEQIRDREPRNEHR